MVHRLGLGRVRHLAVGDLWIQGACRDGLFDVSRIGGAINPADVLTKSVGAEGIQRMLEVLGMKVTDGRPEVAPRLR